jgi:hypothetical protein
MSILKLICWRIGVGLSGQLILLIGPSLAQANGGTILLVEQVGAYELTVTASPYPLAAGVTNDISILVGRQSDSQVVPEAVVILIAEPVDHPGEPQRFAATHANATNKLYYAANVVFSTSGRWKLTVRVEGPEGSVSTAFETQVEPQRPLSFPRFVSFVGLPLIVMVVLFFVLSRRAGKEFDSALAGDD